MKRPQPRASRLVMRRIMAAYTNASLLANDKFCTTRHARLSLGHSRHRPNLMRHQTDEATDARTYPPAGTTRHGGNDETSVARTQGNGGTTGRPRSLGPSVPDPPAVEPRKRSGS